MTEHTETPYRTVKDGDGFIWLQNKDRVVAKISTLNLKAEANAKFIVKACNSHAKLVEALKDIRTTVKEWNEIPEPLQQIIEAKCWLALAQLDKDGLIDEKEKHYVNLIMKLQKENEELKNSLPKTIDNI